MSRSPELAPPRPRETEPTEEPAYVQPEIPGMELPENVAVPDDISELEETSADEEPGSSEPELRGFKEERLAEQLLNPELKGVKKFKDTVGQYAINTINGIETAYHKGADIKSSIRSWQLRGRLGRARRRQQKLERKMESTMFRFRRNSLSRKIDDQKNVVRKRNKIHQKHLQEVDKRHKRRENAREHREDVHGVSHELKLIKAEEAVRRRSERRERRLKKLGELNMSPEAREELEYRKDIIGRAIRLSYQREREERERAES